MPVGSTKSSRQPIQVIAVDGRNIDALALKQSGEKPSPQCRSSGGADVAFPSLQDCLSSLAPGDDAFGRCAWTRSSRCNGGFCGPGDGSLLGSAGLRREDLRGLATGEEDRGGCARSAPGTGAHCEMRSLPEGTSGLSGARENFLGPGARLPGNGRLRPGPCGAALRRNDTQNAGGIG